MKLRIYLQNKRFLLNNFKKGFSSVQITSYENNKKICFLTLDNSKKRNALNEKVLQDLKNGLLQIKRTFEESKGNNSSVVVLNSVGPVFSSGHDLKELSTMSNDQQKLCFNLSGEIMTLINSHPSIFISEIQGLATAAGLQLALSCDLSIASSHSQFSTPGIKLGLFCTTPAVALSNFVSSKRALHLLLTGETIDAKTALDWGMVNKIVDIPENNEYEESRKKLREESIKYAESIACFSSQTYSLGKKAFYNQLKMNNLEEKYKYASCIMSENFDYSDCKEGVKSFVEKRKPKFEF